MHGVELDTVTIFEDLRSADQRDIVIMDDIEALAQNLLNALRLQQRVTGLLRCQRRQQTEWALEPVHRHVDVIGITCRRISPVRKPVGIDAMDDINVMPTLRQLM